MLRQGLRPLLARLRPARAFAAHTMNVPSMGDSITEGTIAGVEKAVGDAVALDEIVAIIDTDKVSVEVRADAAGVIEEIFVAEDDNVEVGAQLLRIETNGAAAPAPAAPAAAPAEAQKDCAPVGDGWWEKKDPASGRCYYVHESTGACQWEKPVAKPPQSPSFH